MKVLIIVPRFGTIHRGLETYVKELISNIDTKQFNITILSNEHNEKFENIKFKKYRLHNREKFDWIFRCKVFRKLLSYFNVYGSADFESLSLMHKSKNFLIKNSFDIIIPFGGYWSFFILNKLIDRKKTKIISVGQASVVKNEILQSDYFVALTPFAYEEASKIMDKKKIALIPNGVNMQKFYPTNTPAQNTILCVAAFSSDKNHISLLNALEKIPTNVKLILVGKGPLESSLKKHPVNQTHNIIFKSARLEDMPSIYREASVFTLASAEEAFGIVFLEALATGLNVVAYNAPRQKFVVGKSGFFCDVFNTTEYAKSLQEALITQQKDSNLMQAQKFSWKNIAVEYEKFFAKVIHEK